MHARARSIPIAMSNRRGGGWCYTLEDCVARSKGGDGSSAFDAPKEDDPSGGAFMSADPFVNPDFYDWNHVFAWYCDGGSWSGDREAPVTAATGEKLYFRGARNTAALIRSLSSQGRGLGDATRVLLSGGSAGGLTTILKADEWAKALPTAQIKAMPNAGFFLPHATARGTGTSYLDEMRVAWDTHNLTAGVPGTCLEAMEAQGRPAWECAFAPIAIEYVEAPVLLLQGAYDQWQANEILRIGCSYAPTAKTSQRVCGANDTARLTAYAMEVAGGAGSSTKLNEPGSGAWMHSCYFHDLMRESANWVAVHSSGVAARDAVRRWFFEGVGGVTMPCFWTPGAEGVNCEPTCPAPLDKTRLGGG